MPICPQCGSSARYFYGGERGEAGPFIYCDACEYDEEESKNQMKLCKDCKHCVVENRECIHPNNVDFVTGKRDAKLCDDMRTTGPCGPEGRWWFGKGVVDSKVEAPRLFDPTKVHHDALIRDNGTGVVSAKPERF